VKVKDLLPGAAQPLLVLLRSYYWCGTQRLLVRLRSDYWRGYAASIIGAATTADQQGGIQILILVLWCCHHGGSAGRCGSGAAQLSLVLLRSYFWCCYAAIIGAATQLSLVRLRSYHWCGYAAIIMCNHSHSEFLCSFSKFFFKCFPHDHRGFYYWCCYHGGSEKYAENCKRNEDVTDSLQQCQSVAG